MLKDEYKHYKRVLQRLIRHAKNYFYNKQFHNAGKDTRKIWNIINEVIDRKQCRKKLPTSFQYRGKSLINEYEIAKWF